MHRSLYPELRHLAGNSKNVQQRTSNGFLAKITSLAFIRILYIWNTRLVFRKVIVKHCPFVCVRKLAEYLDVFY